MGDIFVNISDVKTGMKIAESIYNDYGAIIINKGTILDDRLVEKIKNLDIYRIRVENEYKVYDVSEHFLNFKQEYTQDVDTVKGILHDISIGKPVEMEKVTTVRDDIFVKINDNRDIISCINQMRRIDEYTYTHSINVSMISMLLGKWLRLDKKKIKMLIQAGLLHDIGKAKISDSILNKQGKLTDEEFEEMKKHPTYGFRILQNIPNINKEICMSVLMHHEKEDGSGYPIGAKGNKIPLFAKIIAVADIYDAMTSNRVYRSKGTPFEVFELLENNVYGLLDYHIVNVFLNNIAAYYMGDMVRLNNGDVGQIVYINPRNVSRPVVKVENYFFDLLKHSDIKIVELV